MLHHDYFRTCENEYKSYILYSKLPLKSIKDLILKEKFVFTFEYNQVFLDNFYKFIESSFSNLFSINNTSFLVLFFLNTTTVAGIETP